VIEEVLMQNSFFGVEKTRHLVLVGGGSQPSSLTIVQQREIFSLRSSWSSLGVASDKSIRSDCAYGWEETSTPFIICFTFSSSDKYFHPVCIILNVMMKFACL
jgi:hypothetical protein